MGIPSGYSVVIPCYNSQDTLSPLIAKLARVLPALATDYEVILVNDASHDNTWAVIARLVQEYPWVQGINLMRNYGQHNALLCGIRAAHLPFLITIDDDLQHPPEEIVKLCAKLGEEYDVVYGTPQHQQHGLWRDLASQITKLALQSAIGAKTASKVSAFRVFRTDLRRGFANYQGSDVSIDVLLTWATTRFAAVEVRHEPRLLGTSNYTFWKLVRHALNMMTGFSTWPLQMASALGLFFTFFGGLVLLYVLGRYFILGDAVPGFPFLASMLAIFSGAQLFILGIIGEYLARMHFRIMDRPAYAIREVLGDPASEIAPDLRPHVEPSTRQ